MAENLKVRYYMRAGSIGAPFVTRSLKALTEQEAMAEAVTVVLLNPNVTYTLIRETHRVVGRYVPVAALVKEWEGG